MKIFNLISVIMLGINNWMSSRHGGILFQSSTVQNNKQDASGMTFSSLLLQTLIIRWSFFIRWPQKPLAMVSLTYI